jgi:hypothetical protein
LYPFVTEMRTVWFSIGATLLLAGVAAAATAIRPLEHGTSQGVSVNVYAPGRAIFDLTHATRNALQHLRGPSVGAGCVKARLDHGLWKAMDYFGTNRPLTRRIGLDLAPTYNPPSAGPPPFKAPYDGCELGGYYGHQWNDAWGTRDAVEIALTVAGRHFFNDRAAARDLAYFVRAGRVQKIRTSANPRPGLESFVRRYPHRVVEMPRASARVPRHVIGFWIGPQTLVFTTTSSTGRRLFVLAKRGTLKLPSKNLGDLAFVF